ncbi:MAG: response regulator transcription factor [Bacilli bacterium]|jgi:two-component system alkaline phosphatase synthesis response regulator PhoP|nr:response regulator transcription factor [Bacilli bacterium]HHU24320.1 response regulator transcription factor [Acholeplasmataceae bacterium]
MKEKIFFVEDDESIYYLIEAALSAGGYEKRGFVEPLAMLEVLEEEKPHLIVLDLMLPNLDGFEVLKHLKSNSQLSHIPVIILSAKSSEPDIVKGLDMGASDYITKPFGVLEFISRIRANLRKVDQINQNVLIVRDLQLNLDKHSCTLCNVPLDLTVKEYQVLKLLMENVGNAITRERLLRDIWGYDQFAETRSLDVHIKTIRDKFAKVTSDVYIETIRGIGYIIPK